MPSLGIGHHAGCTIGKSRTHGSRWRRRQMCCQRVCGSTPGDWDSNNPVLAVSLRRCRTTAYTSSAVPRFINMLLSPRPFESRSVVRLGVIDPELRPPLVAIRSVRDMAHTFIAHGSRKRGLYRKLPFHQLHGLHRGQLAHSLVTFVPSSPPSSSGPLPCTRLSRVPTPMPHLTACWALEFRLGFPMPPLHPP